MYFEWIDIFKNATSQRRTIDGKISNGLTNVAFDGVSMSLYDSALQGLSVHNEEVTVDSECKAKGAT